ncbi:MAG: glycosyl hydrolase family 28-related protein [Limisphaerales bacterium]
MNIPVEKIFGPSSGAGNSRNIYSCSTDRRRHQVFMSRRLILLAVVIIALTPALALAASDVYSVLDFGAKRDGKTDATSAFQKAIDAASEAGGGIVYAPRGNYFFSGHLDLPRAVTLKGVWESVPAHNGIRDKGGVTPTEDGTTFLVTENAGNENGAPFITMHDDSTLKGVVLYYPNQSPDAEPKPYPWAIAMRGKNPAVLDVELLNPYNGIDASDNERHLIRDVQGQPLRRGIFVDEIYDIGRIEDVHFNPWWSIHRRLFQWQQEHGEAFIFARSDWEYVFNTFCYGYNVGYRFIKSKAGVCNGNFLGIGADDCFTSVEVDESSEYGLLISNGEFTAFHGPDPTMVCVGPNNSGSVRFENCAFWGPCNQIAKIAGTGTVGFGDCTFVQWDRNGEGRAAIQAQAGTVLVRGCEFQEDKPQVELDKAVRRAVITGNVFTGEARITNNCRHAVINDNVGD